MLNRLKNKKGFTLSETMAALLILSLVIVLTGGGVIVVKNAYQRITLKANAQVLMSTTITKVNDEFKYAKDVTTTVDPADSSKTYTTFVSGNSNLKTAFKNDTSKGIELYYIYGDNVKTTQLLSNKTMTDGMIPSITYDYSTSDKLFTATITIKKGDSTISTQELKVRPIEE